MTDLREELRLIGCHANGDARCTCNIGQDALALIDCQAAEIERLTRERDEAQRMVRVHDHALRDQMDNRNAANARATAAEAERDALRDALMKIADMTGAAWWAPATGERWLDRIDETARVALGRQP